jgi:excisionase family DNA binding protein
MAREEERKLLLSIETVAHQLSLRVPTIRLWAAQRKISSVKLGRRRLIPADEVERLIEASTIPAYRANHHDR